MNESTERESAMRSYLKERAPYRDDNEFAFIAGWEASGDRSARAFLEWLEGEGYVIAYIDRDGTLMPNGNNHDQWLRAYRGVE